jgi:hypothetical protein
VKYILMTAAAAMVLGAGAPAAAQNSGKIVRTPSNFSYDLQGKRKIPKATSRVEQADGSWVEETKRDGCTIVRTGRGEQISQVETKC